MKELHFDIKTWWENTYPEEGLEYNIKPIFFFRTTKNPMRQNEYFEDGWSIKFLFSENKIESTWEKGGENKIDHKHVKPCNYGIIKMHTEKDSSKFNYNEKYENDVKKYSKEINQNGNFNVMNFRELEGFKEDGVMIISDIGYQESTSWTIHSNVHKEVEKEIRRNGEITLIEKMILNNGKNEYYREERGALIVKKTRIETPEEIHLKIEKYGQGLEKISKCVLKTDGSENGTINRIRRGEILKKTWEKSSIDLKIEKSKEFRDMKIGLFKYINGDNKYEIAWIMTDKYFNGKFNIFNSQSKCINYYKKSELEDYEFTEYEKENSKWGSVEKNYSNEKFNLQWIKNKPQIYEELTKDIVYLKRNDILGTIKSQEILREYKEQTKILFEFVEEMKINKFPNPRLFRMNNNSEEIIDKQVMQVLDIVKKNAELTNQVIKNQKVRDTQAKFEKCENYQLEAYKDIVKHGYLNSKSLLVKIENY